MEDSGRSELPVEIPMVCAAKNDPRRGCIVTLMKVCADSPAVPQIPTAPGKGEGDIRHSKVRLIIQVDRHKLDLVLCTNRKIELELQEFGNLQFFGSSWIPCSIYALERTL